LAKKNQALVKEMQAAEAKTEQMKQKAKNLQAEVKAKLG